MAPINQSTSFNIKVFILPFILKSSLKQASRTTYTSRLLNFATWLKQNKIQCPTEHDVHIFYTYLKENRQLTPSSSNGYVTTLKIFFAWLSAEQIYPDIAHSLKGQKKITDNKKEFLRPTHIKKILTLINCETLDGKRDFALINLILLTGLRSIEIPDIIRGDIANCCGQHVLWIKSKNSDGKNKALIIPDHIFNSIITYLEARGSINDSDPLIASHSKKNFGQTLTPWSITRIIRNRFHLANIDICNISPSILRYTALRSAQLRSSKYKLPKNTY